MILIDLIQMLESLDNDLTIYAQKSAEWNENSLAVAELEPEDGSLPVLAKGMAYFLEVYIAKEVIEVYQNKKKVNNLTASEKFKAVLFYAENDAYLT